MRWDNGELDIHVKCTFLGRMSNLKALYDKNKNLGNTSKIAFKIQVRGQNRFTFKNLLQGVLIAHSTQSSTFDVNTQLSIIPHQNIASWPNNEVSLAPP